MKKIYFLVLLAALSFQSAVAQNELQNPYAVAKEDGFSYRSLKKLIDMDNDAWNDAVRAPIEPTDNDTEYYATEKRKWELMKHPEKQRGNQNGKPGTTPRFKQTTKKNATKTNLFGYWSKNGTIEYAPNSRNQMTVIVQLVKFFREKKLANGFFNKKISSGNQDGHTGR